MQISIFSFHPVPPNWQKPLWLIHLHLHLHRYPTRRVIFQIFWFQLVALGRKISKNRTSSLLRSYIYNKLSTLIIPSLGEPIWFATHFCVRVRNRPFRYPRITYGVGHECLIPSRPCRIVSQASFSSN